MTIDQKLNLRNPSFNEKMDKLVEYIGIDSLIPFIPARKDEIRTALKNNDTALNTIPLSRWDRASGFSVYGSKVDNLYCGVSRLLLSRGINCFSLSECVSLLKHAAIKWAEND